MVCGIPVAMLVRMFSKSHKTTFKTFSLSIILTVNIFAPFSFAQDIKYHVGNQAVSDALTGEHQENYCTELNTGERRSVIIDREVWYAPTRYVITRTSQNNYLVDLNIEFRPSDDYEGEYQEEVAALFSDFNLNPGSWDKPDTFYTEISKLNPNAESKTRQILNHFDQYYREKVRKCIDLYQEIDLLKDTEGRRFYLRLNDGPQNDVNKTGLPQKAIYIANQIGRNYSEYLSGDITCDTIIHELFHHTGLIDEYIGGLCRAKSPGPSLMGENWSRPQIYKSIAGYGFGHLECACDKSSCASDFSSEQEASRYFASGKVNTCPSGYKSLGYSEQRYLWRPITYVADNFWSLKIPVGIEPELSEKYKSDEGVFRAGHGDQLIYPGCSAKNKKYIECGSLAYQQECSNVPTYCRSGDWIRK